MSVRQVLLCAVCATAAAAGVTRHVVMTADPGYYSGESEGHYIQAAMQRVANVSTQLPQCAEVLEGTLGDVPALLVTTGIGHDSAAACMVETLAKYDNGVDQIAEIVYLGTSGWSPTVGGLFTPHTNPQCGRRQPSTYGKLIGIGDVCVSPNTFLYNCGFCKWPETAYGQCAQPDCTGSNETSVFGQCQYMARDTRLADDIVRTAARIHFNARNAQLSEYIDKYWQSMWHGLDEPQTRPAAIPNVYGRGVCAEAASYNLWNGVPYDARCRTELAAMLGGNATAENVVCVSAMEGPGWVSVLTRRQAKTGRHIPFANVRAASNYDVWPLTAGATLERNETWLPQKEQDDFTRLGYHYAIHSASAVVLAKFGIYI